jgi:hypothetical protein
LAKGQKTSELPKGFVGNDKQQIAYGLLNVFANGWANQTTHGKWRTADRREMLEGLQVDKQKNARSGDRRSLRKWIREPVFIAVFGLKMHCMAFILER